MVFNISRKIIKYLKYRRLYPNAHISSQSEVVNTSIGRNVLINKNCRVLNSNLADAVTIQDHSCILNSKLHNNITINSQGFLSNVAMDKFSYVSSNSKLDLVEVGSFCSLGPELICGYGEHPTDFLSTNPVFFSTLKQCGTSFADKDYFQERKKIFIGHDVWIGARVFIKDGVRIGNGSIIGAGAVVVKDIPDYAIVGGVPAKILRFRFSDEIIRELLDIQWWNWSEDKLLKAQAYFVKKDIYSFIEWTRKEELINKSLSVPSGV